MDRVIALIILIFLLPLLILLLLVSWVDTKANPIFCQIRTTDGCNQFIFYKIRSMKSTAPNVPTGEFNNAKKYISSWGRFLRLYSLDELLNLVCIVKGDMNFIGPRPIMPCEYGLIKLRKDNGVNCMAGITGLAQVNGRDLISVERKIACERYYSRNKKSLKIRLFILLKTASIVIKKTGITH